MTYEWHDFVGNLGVLLVLGAYLALQLERTDARSVLYSGANALGAILILVTLSYDFNLSSFIIEIAWLSISLIGIGAHVRRRIALRDGES